MIAAIGLIMAVGVLWRVWAADLPRAHTGRRWASLLVTLAVCVLALAFF